MPKGSMPVLIGVGQAVSQWDGSAGADDAPSPRSLAVEASKAALADTGVEGALGSIDMLAVVRTTEDSTPNPRHPNGENSNPPGTIARDLGASPANAIYSIAGGQTPQSLVNEMAGRIHGGEIEAALITGAQANRAAKGARRNGIELDWSDEADSPFEDRGIGSMLLTRAEIKHGLVMPAIFYALFENALAAREGRTRTQHRQVMSELFEGFSKIAADNRYAQFPTARTAEFLATPTKENFELVDPYLKWHVAQESVNQAAAVIVAAEETADRLGVAADKRVYLHGAGEAADGHISERHILDGSWAMDIALNRALDAAERKTGDFALFDLYSCFPIAVFSSTAILGIDWRSETRPLTVTGGLPYFGGPGNNYSLHGIASMVERLRGQRGDYGLVLANGGWMTKEAAGVYSTNRPNEFRPAAPMANPDKEPPALINGPASGTLESYALLHRGRDGQPEAPAFGRTATGERFLAKASAKALPRLREECNPIGAPISIVADDEVNTFDFD
ncbi:MAG: acetyl-CoA acetyltransferase [Pseudomonadota bacterium]